MTYENDHIYPKMITSFSREGGSWQQEGVVNITNVKVNSAGMPTLLELTTTAEGMTFNMKMEMTYDGDISMTKMSTDMMGSWAVMSEMKSEIVDKGNPVISKAGENLFPNSHRLAIRWQRLRLLLQSPTGQSFWQRNHHCRKPEWRLNGTILEVPAAENGIEDICYRRTAGKEKFHIYNRCFNTLTGRLYRENG